MTYTSNDSRTWVRKKNVGNSIGLAFKWEKQHSIAVAIKQETKTIALCLCAESTWNVIDLENMHLGWGYFKKNYIRGFKIYRPSSIP